MQGPWWASGAKLPKADDFTSFKNLNSDEKTPSPAKFAYVLFCIYLNYATKYCDLMESEAFYTFHRCSDLNELFINAISNFHLS
jgi:hypothetical protein